MEIKFHNGKDFYSGLIFISFGGFAVIGAKGYPMGTAGRMGPGYFPTVLGGLLILLGLIISIRSLTGIKGESIKEWGIRPLALVLGAVIAFALIVERLGLLLAMLALISVSSLGTTESRLREVAVLFLVLAAMAVGIFAYGLKLPFRVWPI